MQAVLQFPAKVFVQWGAIAQEIVPYLAQRGAKRDEICAVLDRLRTRWEQLEPDDAAEVSRQLEEGEPYVSRHWRSQCARMLIESALADYQRHAGR
ncbi:MAG: hypothetical protein ACRYF7_24440 [Janthinobacterium lividum]